MVRKDESPQQTLVMILNRPKPFKPSILIHHQCWCDISSGGTTRKRRGLRGATEMKFHRILWRSSGAVVDAGIFNGSFTSVVHSFRFVSRMKLFHEMHLCRGCFNVVKLTHHCPSSLFHLTPNSRESSDVLHARVA